jgi:protein dithiol oxidoreductase (disulfide-forming)
MIKHPLGLLLLLASLSACARDNPAPSAEPATVAAAASAAAANPAPPAPGAGTALKVAGDLATAAATQQEGADIPAAADTGESQLERIAAMPSEGQLPAGKWVAGTNYKVISPAQPTNVGPGKVEVIEMFWYGCPHCFALDPYLESWRKNKPSYIDFTRVPVVWSEAYRAHAKLFYTLEALGKLDQLHSKVFAEIHQNNNPLVGRDEAETLKLQTAFALANGVSAADFQKAYESFSVNTNLQKAEDLVERYKIDSVPTIIINGKYVTDVGMAGNQENVIKIINDLAASEKHH